MNVYLQYFVLHRKTIFSYLLLYVCISFLTKMDASESKLLTQKKIAFVPLTSATRDLISEGERYYFGIGHEKNMALAKQCFQIAKKRNDDDWAKMCAYLYLGKMYCLGLGQPLDHNKAFKYFSKIETQCINILAKAQAYVYKGQLHYLWQEYAQAKQYFRLASRIQFPRIDERHYLPILLVASVFLGRLSFHGQEVEQDYVEAYINFQRVVNQNNDPWAQAFSWAYLGVMYYFGFGVKKNEKQAMLYLRRVDEQSINQEAKAFIRNYPGKLSITITDDE